MTRAGLPSAGTTLTASFVMTVSACAPAPAPTAVERTTPTVNVAPEHTAPTVQPESSPSLQSERVPPVTADPQLPDAPESPGRIFTRRGECYWQRDFKCPELKGLPVPCNPPRPMRVKCPKDSAQ